MRGVLLSLVLLGRLVLAADAPGDLREVVVTGSTVYDASAARKILRLRDGQPLRRDAESLARVFESYYRNAGYLGTRVEATFDPDTGRLTLAVTEARLTHVEVRGLDGAARERAVLALALKPGAVLREAEIEAAIDRLEHASEGAVKPTGEPGYTVLGGGTDSALAMDLAGTRASWRPRIGGLETTSFFSRVDGLAPWLGAEMLAHDLGAYDHLVLYARGAYGFSSKDPRFVLGAQRPFGAQRIVLGYEFHDLSDTDDGFRAPPQSEALANLFLHRSYWDVFRRRGHEGYAALRLGAGGEVGLAYRSDDEQSLPVTEDFSFFDKDKETRPNPTIDPGRLASVVVSLRFATRGALYADARRARDARPLRSLYGPMRDHPAGLRADLSFEVADPGLGGDFSFQRFIANLRGTHRLGPRHELELRTLLGLSGGELPRQKGMALGGHSYLDAYEFKEFAGTDMAYAIFEWRYHFKRILVPVPVLYYEAGGTWGGTETGSGYRSDVGAALEWDPSPKLHIRFGWSTKIR